MMKKTLKFLFLITAVALLGILFAISAFAEIYTGNCGAEGDNVTYKLDTSTGLLEITGTGAMEDYTSSSDIPWCSNRSSVKTVKISDGVTSIGESAFYYCSGLTSVTIPDSVTSIGGFAFDNTAYNNNSSNWENEVLYIGNHLIKAKTSISGSYSIREGTKTIASYAFLSCSSLTSVIIPDSVTSIGERAFWFCRSLASVTIPDSVTSIGSSAFEYCSSLTSVTIPENVTSIGDDAFYSCDSLDSVIIPENVTSIGDNAFNGCNSLTAIEVDENNEYYCDIAGVLFTKNKKILVVYPAGGSTAYTIPDSVTSLGDYAFYGCSSLTSVTIPDSVTSIGNDAFCNCSSLTSVTIPDSVTSIGYSAFRDCSSLTSVTIPDSVTSIGSDAFYNTSYYNNSSNWENEVLYIGNHLIEAKTSLSGSYSIREGTKTIADSAFYNCSSLTSVTIPDSVTSIGSDAFYKCSSLKNLYITDLESWLNVKLSNYYSRPLSSAGGNLYIGGELATDITIPDSVTSIGDSAFYNCSSLTSVTIPDSVTSIGNYAFSWCSSLKNLYITDLESWLNVKLGSSSSHPLSSAGGNLYIVGELATDITIPDSVTSIGSYAFYKCSSLTSVTIPDSVTSIGNYAFSWCSSLTSVTIPDSVTSIGDHAFCNCSSLNGIKVDENNEYYCDIAGVLFTKDKKILIQYPTGNNATVYSIPDSVTSIGSYAFWYCSSLTSVTIPDSVTSIGEWAFEDCSSLTSVTIGDSVTSIGSYAFSYCSSLTSVTFETKNVTFGFDVFYNCSKLKTIYLYRNSTADEYFSDEKYTKIYLDDMQTKAGDINGDGNVDIKDIVLFSQYLAGWNVSIDSVLSDCNCDGKINIKDVVLLAQYLAGWNVTLG